MNINGALVLVALAGTVFGYLFGVSMGYAVGRGRRWLDAKLEEQAMDRMRGVSGRQAASMSDDWDDGYEAGFKDANVLKLRRD